MRKAFYATAAVWLLILAAPLAQGEGPMDETRFALRQEFLRVINRDRVQFGLRPVELDTQVSVQSDDYCREQIRNRTTGHFTVDGEPPYMRYSMAGGNDGVSENAAAWSATYGFSDRALYEMIKRSQSAMMAETAPHDGHRRSILDPFATHVGIGLAWDRGEFRLTQEFIRRYINWGRALPRVAETTDHVVCTGRPRDGYEVVAISVHHESLPQPITATVANSINSYHLPAKRRDYLPRLKTFLQTDIDGRVHEIREEYSETGHRGDFRLSTDHSFAFAVPFVDGPGLYTVVVWVHKDGGTASIAASNVSIRVNAPAIDETAARAERGVSGVSALRSIVSSPR
jgi:uncharacterized protein YkwD